MIPPSIAIGLSIVGNALYDLIVACHLRECHTRRQYIVLCHAALSVSWPLRAMVEASAVDPRQPAPLLQGQTQETALQNGTIVISDLSLLARPGSYIVTVTLPDYPLVSTAIPVAHGRSFLVISLIEHAECGPCI